jgi:heme exporter protein D
MDQIASFLKMGGYAGFVWPAFGIALAVMAGFVISSLRTLRAREATLRALEAAAPDSPRRRRGQSTETAPGEPAEGKEAKA